MELRVVESESREAESRFQIPRTNFNFILRLLIFASNIPSFASFSETMAEEPSLNISPAPAHDSARLLVLAFENNCYRSVEQ